MYFQLSMQEIIFDYETCKVYTLRDMSDMIKATDLSQKNKIHLMLFQNITQESIMPIRCII